MSRAIRVETRSRLKDDMKRAMHSVGKVRKWEKKWVRIGDTSMQIYKWMPLKADEQPQQGAQATVVSESSSATQEDPHQIKNQVDLQQQSNNSINRGETQGFMTNGIGGDTLNPPGSNSQQDHRIDTKATSNRIPELSISPSTTITASIAGKTKSDDQLPSPPAKRLKSSFDAALESKLETNTPKQTKDELMQEESVEPQFNELRRVSLIETLENNSAHLENPSISEPLCTNIQSNSYHNLPHPDAEINDATIPQQNKMTPPIANSIQPSSERVAISTQENNCVMNNNNLSEVSMDFEDYGSIARLVTDQIVARVEVDTQNSCLNNH